MSEVAACLFTKMMLNPVLDFTEPIMLTTLYPNHAEHKIIILNPHKWEPRTSEMQTRESLEKFFDYFPRKEEDK